MRYKFTELFTEDSNGLTPQRLMKLKTNILSPGITFRKGITFKGIDIFDFKGMDIEANCKAGVLIITGFYSKA